MPPQKKKTENPPKTDEKDPLGHTAVYEKDPKTGLWIVKNPSGSIAYNYLYRDNDIEEENDK